MAGVTMAGVTMAGVTMAGATLVGVIALGGPAIMATTPLRMSRRPATGPLTARPLAIDCAPSDGSAPAGSRYSTCRDGVQPPPWRMHDPEDRIFCHQNGRTWRHRTRRQWNIS